LIRKAKSDEDEVLRVSAYNSLGNVVFNFKAEKMLIKRYGYRDYFSSGLAD